MTVSKKINVVCIVQARIGSTRLYGKILKKIHGEYSALDYLIKRLKKRPGFNYNLFIKLKKIQLPLDYKMKKSHFIIKNNFTNKSVKRDIKYILKRIL